VASPNLPSFPVKLHCTFTRTLRPLNPQKAGVVSMYCCGPTVYDYAHIGNLRTYLCEDFFRRLLEVVGYRVNHVTNITDVGHLVTDGDEGEDKMEKGSRRTGKSAWEIADYYTQQFLADLDALNIVRPHQMPKATDYIQEQIDTIRSIQEKGLAYITSDGVYFDTSKQSDYGALAKLDREGLQGGARVDVGEKRNITDFALWKFSPESSQRQMEWDSPWGRGFPGWHIECTAMSVKLLGSYFDVHWGGEDHIPVHHTNEIAQCQAAHGTREADFWLHVKFLTLGQEKMSKSAGTFLRMKDLVEQGVSPLAYRYLCLGAHYRASMEFSWDHLKSAETTLSRLVRLVESLPTGGQVHGPSYQEFLEAVCNDLGTPQALAVLWKMLKDDGIAAADRRATALAFDALLGLHLANPALSRIQLKVPVEVETWAKERLKARQEKRYADGDALKKQIVDAGYEVLDTASEPGYELRRKS
jgi:cysteinyl-tRNA synthetase